MTEHSTARISRLKADILEALPRVRRFARSLAGNAADADDLMQATAERVLVNGVPEDVDVLRWMFKVCKNLYIDQLRAENVRRRAAERPELCGEAAVCGEAVAHREIELGEIDCAMAQLGEHQRVAITLIAVEGLSYKDAAKVLDVPIGTVMSRLARARAGLADALGDGEGGRKSRPKEKDE